MPQNQISAAQLLMSFISSEQRKLSRNLSDDSFAQEILSQQEAILGAEEVAPASQGRSDKNSENEFLIGTQDRAGISAQLNPIPANTDRRTATRPAIKQQSVTASPGAVSDLRGTPGGPPTEEVQLDLTALDQVLAQFGVSAETRDRLLELAGGNRQVGVSQVSALLKENAGVDLKVAAPGQVSRAAVRSLLGAKSGSETKPTAAAADQVPAIPLKGHYTLRDFRELIAGMAESAQFGRGGFEPGDGGGHGLNPGSEGEAEINAVAPASEYSEQLLDRALPAFVRSEKRRGQFRHSDGDVTGDDGAVVDSEPVAGGASAIAGGGAKEGRTQPAVVQPSFDSGRAENSGGRELAAAAGGDADFSRFTDAERAAWTRPGRSATPNEPAADRKTLFSASPGDAKTGTPNISTPAALSQDGDASCDDRQSGAPSGMAVFSEGRPSGSSTREWDRSGPAMLAVSENAAGARANPSAEHRSTGAGLNQGEQGKELLEEPWGDVSAIAFETTGDDFTADGDSSASEQGGGHGERRQAGRGNRSLHQRPGELRYGEPISTRIEEPTAHADSGEPAAGLEEADAGAAASSSPESVQEHANWNERLKTSMATDSGTGGGAFGEESADSNPFHSWNRFVGLSGARLESQPGTGSFWEGPHLALADGNWPSQLAQQFKDLRQQSVNQLVLRLEPAGLGSLVLRLRNKDNMISASISADNETTRQILIQNAPTLRQEMEQQGFSLSGFSVDLGTHTQSGGERRAQAEAGVNGGRFGSALGEPAGGGRRLNPATLMAYRTGPDPRIHLIV